MDPYIVAFFSAIAIMGLSLAAIAGLAWLAAKKIGGYDLEPAIIGGALSGLIGGLGAGLLGGYWVYFKILTAITG